MHSVDVRATLEDANELIYPTGKVTVSLERYSIYVAFKGYGDYVSANGYGTQVTIEYRNGTPHVIVYADINQEGPTHVISLEGALESKRRGEG